MTAQATASLQTQVAALRNNASRMPPPFSDMLRGAAAEFEGSIAASTAGQLLQSLRDQVTPFCQQTIIKPLSVRTRRQPGGSARRFRQAVQSERHHRQVLHPVPGALCRHVATGLGVAQGKPGRAFVVAGDAEAVSECGLYPRRVFSDRRQHADGVARHQAARLGRSRRRRQNRNWRNDHRKPGLSGPGFRVRRAASAAAAAKLPGRPPCNGPVRQPARPFPSATKLDRRRSSNAPARGLCSECLRRVRLTRQGRNCQRELHCRRTGVELSDFDRIGSQPAQSGDP